jgi:hypothetical protein
MAMMMMTSVSSSFSFLPGRDLVKLEKGDLLQQDDFLGLASLFLLAFHLVWDRICKSKYYK